MPKRTSGARGAAGRKAWGPLLLVSLTLATVLAGCGGNLLKEALEKTEIKVIGVEVDRGAVDFLGQTRDIIQAVLLGGDPRSIPRDRDPQMTLLLSVTNHNDFDFTIESADLDLYINDRHVARGGVEYANTLVLKAGEAVNARLPLNVSLAGLLIGAGNVAAQQEVYYRIVGPMMVATENGQIRVPMDVKGKRLPLLKLDPDPDLGDGLIGPNGLPAGTMMD